MVRTGEVDDGSGGILDMRVVMKRGAGVGTDGQKRRASELHQANGPSVQCLGCPVRHFSNQQVASCALHQGHYSRLLPEGAPLGVDLPVALYLRGLNFHGSLVNHSLALHPPATFRAVAALAPFVTSAQLGIQLAAVSPVAPHVPVDGLEADPEPALLMQRAGNLLRAPLLLEQFLQLRVLHGIMVWATATSP